MVHLDFSNYSNKILKKLSVIFMPDSFFYAVIDDCQQIVHHQTFEKIHYSDDISIQNILTALHPFNFVDNISVLSMNDYSIQSPVRDDKILDILPSTQHKINFIEVIPGQNLYNYFQLNPAQDKIFETLIHNKDYKLNDMVSLLSLYHTVHNGNILHIHIAQQRVYIYCQSNGQLLFYRGFQFEQKEDVLYFALAGKNLFLTDEYTTYISGNIIENSPIYTLLNQYTQNLRSVGDEKIEVSKQDYNKKDSHHYFMHLGSFI